MTTNQVKFFEILLFDGLFIGISDSANMGEEKIGQVGYLTPSDESPRILSCDVS